MSLWASEKPRRYKLRIKIGGKMGNVKYKNGFSLIEVLIAVLIVGLAIVSLVAANGAFTMANGAGADLSTAEFLFEQIRELTAPLPVIDPQTGTSTFGSETAVTDPNVETTWTTSTVQVFLRR